MYILLSPFQSFLLSFYSGITDSECLCECLFLTSCLEFVLIFANKVIMVILTKYCIYIVYIELFCNKIFFLKKTFFTISVFLNLLYRCSFLLHLLKGYWLYKQLRFTILAWQWKPLIERARICKGTLELILADSSRGVRK